MPGAVSYSCQALNCISSFNSTRGLFPMNGSPHFIVLGCWKHGHFPCLLPLFFKLDSVVGAVLQGRRFQAWSENHLYEILQVGYC